MSDKVFDQSINQFLERAISASPTPGGANVAAVAATLAASMVGMVANLTTGKKAYAMHEESARAVYRQCELLIGRLKELTHNDMAAFDDYMQAFRMPKTTEEEKRTQSQALQAAARNATLIPLDICEACLEVTRQAEKIAGFGNTMAVGDAGVGACLALGALQSAMLSVDVNLKDIIDQDFVNDCRVKRNRLLVEGRELCQAALATIRTRTV